MNAKAILGHFSACIPHFVPKESAYIHPALSLALDYAGVNPSELNNCKMCYSCGLYEIQFSTSWLLYHVFVDLQSGSVPGFMTEPLEL